MRKEEDHCQIRMAVKQKPTALNLFGDGSEIDFSSMIPNTHTLSLSLLASPGQLNLSYVHLGRQRLGVRGISNCTVDQTKTKTGRIPPRLPSTAVCNGSLDHTIQNPDQIRQTAWRSREVLSRRARSTVLAWLIGLPSVGAFVMGKVRWSECRSSQAIWRGRTETGSIRRLS